MDTPQITSITACGVGQRNGATVFGLGADGNVYIWRPENRTWEIYLP